MARFAVRIRSSHRGRALNLALIGVLLAGLLSIAIIAPSAQTTPQVLLSGGSAWLVSPGIAAVTLVDGPSDQVVASQLLDAKPGDNLTVTQSGTDAYVVNNTQGTVAHIDGAMQQAGPARQFADSPGALRLVAGSRALYVLDANRGLATRVDPVSLRPEPELSLAARPGPSQAVVDGAGRLWVIDSDRGSLTWVDGDTKHIADQAPGPKVRLVLVRDRPVLADLEAGKLSSVGDDGSAETSTCLDVRDGADAELLGSASQDIVFAATSDTGTLLMSSTDTDDCRTALNISDRGDILGTPVSSDRFLFIPDITTGSIVIVDTKTRQLLQPGLSLIDSGHRFELIAKDGLVFYNDLDGDKAGVLKYDGTSWRVGKTLSKYDPSTGEPAQLDAPAAGANGPAAPSEATGPPPASSVNQPPESAANQPPVSAGNQIPTNGPTQAPSTNRPLLTPQLQPNRSPAGGQQPLQPQQTSRPRPQQGDVAGTTTFNVTVSVSGDGQITGPGGLDCPGTCTTTVNQQTPVALIAQPTKATAIVTWTGPCTGQPSTCTFTPTGDVTVDASIVIPPDPALTVTVNGSGTVITPAGTPCGTGCTRIPAGTQVQLTATPDDPAVTIGWSGPCEPPTNTVCSFIMGAADTAVTATFTNPPTAAVNVALAGSGSGSVTITHGTDSKICPTDCFGEWPAGDSVTVLATPDSDSTFEGWAGGDNCGADPGCTFTLAQTNGQLTATFDVIPAAQVVANPDSVDLRQANSDSVTLTLDGGTGTETWTASSARGFLTVSPSGEFNSRQSSLDVSLVQGQTPPDGTTTNVITVTLIRNGANVGSTQISVQTNAPPILSDARCSSTQPNLATVSVSASDANPAGVTVTVNGMTMNGPAGGRWSLEVSRELNSAPVVTFRATDEFGASATPLDPNFASC